MVFFIQIVCLVGAVITISKAVFKVWGYFMN